MREMKRLLLFLILTNVFYAVKARNGDDMPEDIRVNDTLCYNGGKLIFSLPSKMVEASTLMRYHEGMMVTYAFQLPMHLSDRKHPGYISYFSGSMVERDIWKIVPDEVLYDIRDKGNGLRRSYAFKYKDRYYRLDQYPNDTELAYHDVPYWLLEEANEIMDSAQWMKKPDDEPCKPRTKGIMNDLTIGNQ